MAVIVALLRGINVGGHGQIKMDALRELCESLDVRGAQTYIQSGNVVFKTNERDLERLRKRLEEAIERKFGFRPAVILRTAAEVRTVIAKNPFRTRRDIEPGRLLVMFLAGDPGPVRQIEANPEEVRIGGREVYVHYPNGMGRSKLSFALIEKTLGTAGTGRNWNTVQKLLAMAEKLESSG